MGALLHFTSRFEKHPAGLLPTTKDNKVRFKPYPGTRKIVDLLQAVAPIFRYDFASGEMHLVGTGFWVTRHGHLITAAHVVRENMDARGNDIGPIFAIQTLPDHSVVVRNFRKTDFHPKSDLALSETVNTPADPSQPTIPATIALNQPEVGLPIFTFAVISADQQIGDEGESGETTQIFSGTATIDVSAGPVQIRFALRLGFGEVQEIHTPSRDKVMLPFPCIQSSISIYGANSGGPIFDVMGRVRAVNCSGYAGEDISYQALIYDALTLQARPESLSLFDTKRKVMTLAELGFFGEVTIEPPLLDGQKIFSAIGTWLLYVLKSIFRGEKPDWKINLVSFDAPEKSAPSK